MSTAIRVALGVMVAGVIVSSIAADAFAQCGPTNPSGGTSLRQTAFEGSGSFSPAGLLSRDLSFQTGWQGWLSTFAASRYASTVAGRVQDWRSLSAVVRRPTARR